MFGLPGKRSENAGAAGSDLTGLENFVPDVRWAVVKARGGPTIPLPFDDSDASGSP